MEKFKPLSPDPFILDDSDAGVARFGHLNALIDAINATVVPIVGGGLMYQSQYDPLNTGVVNDSRLLNGQLASYYLNRANHTGTQSQATIIGLVGDLALKGDMFKSVYDTNGDGIVNNSALLNSLPGSFYLDRANHTGFQAQSTIVGLVADLLLKEDKANKGIANGYCDLDAGGKVPNSRLNLTALNYKNSWNATTNSPALADGIGISGDTYIVGVGGTIDLGSGNITFAPGDFVIYNGVVWQKVTATPPGVTDVNGYTGSVSLTADDIPETATRFYLNSAENDALANSTYALNAANAVLSQQDLVNVNLALALKGDMFKSTYDTNNNGIVDNSSALGGQLPAFYLNRLNHTGFQPQSSITNLITDLAGKESLVNKGVANGYCELDATGKVPANRLNLSALNYQNSWNVVTNSPFIVNGIGNVGDTYIVGVGGTRNLGAGNITFNVGDFVVYNGTQWQRIATASIGVSDWNGLSGSVNVTTVNLPDAVGFRYLNENQKDAADNSNGPTAANPFVTQTDLVPITTDITTVQGDISTINTTLTGKENKSEKGVANGYPPLDAGGKIPNSYLNFSALNYQNSWNATTNTPALADGTGSAGQAYIVGTAGTQNLGSGAITFAVGDLVVHNGTIWQKITGVPTGVSSVNGFTGAVTLTADNISETATRFFVNSNQNAALDAAVTASGANRFATMADIFAVATSGQFVTPDMFSNGELIGYESAGITLASLGYTNGTAASIWTRVAADPRFTINVATMTISWIALQEMFLAMELDLKSICYDVGGRSYYVNQTLYLPRNQYAFSSIRRSDKFVIDFGGSSIFKSNANNFILIDRHPTDQTDALNLVGTSFYIRNLALYDNNSNRLNYANVLLRPGPSYMSIYENIDFNGGAIGLLMYFNLFPNVRNVRFSGQGIYGSVGCTGGRQISQAVDVATAAWTGATSANSQTNGLILNLGRYAAINGSIAAHIQRGGWGTELSVVDIEASGTITQGWLYEQCDPSEKLIKISNFTTEGTNYSRAGARVLANKGFAEFYGFDMYIPTITCPATVEWEQSIGGAAVGCTCICENFNNGAEVYYHKFRTVTTQAIGFRPKWRIQRCNVWDASNIYANANWDTVTIPSSVIPAANFIQFQKNPDAAGW